MERIIIRGLLLLCLMIVSGCAYRMGTCEVHDQSMKAFNRLLRWHEVESAGMAYLESSLRDTFMKSAADMKKRGVVITDYRILTSECLADKRSAEVIAEFDYYVQPSVRVRSISYRQLWIFGDDDEKKSWKLKSGLPPFD